MKTPPADRTPRGLLVVFKSAVAAEVLAKAKLEAEGLTGAEHAPPCVAYRRLRSWRRAHQAALGAMLPAQAPREKATP